MRAAVTTRPNPGLDPTTTPPESPPDYSPWFRPQACDRGKRWPCPRQRDGRWTSRPVSRILSLPWRTTAAGGHPSRAAVADGLVRPTRKLGRAALPSLRWTLPVWPCSGRGLPSRPGHPGRWWSLTPPFHPYRRLLAGGLFSVALSRGSPRVGVAHRPALWSPDFPRRSLR